jgi:diacylglycerol kinase family enzyme
LLAVATTNRVDVIVNGNARELGAGAPVRLAIEAAARRGGALIHASESLDALDGLVRAVVARGPRAVVLAGGDGSHMNGLSALWRAWPKGKALPAVALAPGGTMNTIARNLGMRSATAAWAERFVDSVCQGTMRARSTATMRVSDDRAGDRIGFIFGSALVARFFHLYDDTPRGPLAAAGIVARVFAGAFTGSHLARFVLDPQAASLHVDGVEQPGRRWSLVVASVVPNLGLGMRPTYRADERLDRFHVVASGLAPRALGSQLHRVLAGRPLAGEPRVDALAREFRIEFDPSDAAAYVLDGDVVRAGEVTVHAGPIVNVLVP